MRVSVLAPAAILAFAASSLASNSHNAIRRPSLPRRLDTEPHHALSDPIAERGLLDALFRRYTGRATWYGVGVTMGACGKWTTPDTRAVALNIALYGNPNAQSGWCGKKLRITAGGRTSIATVVDCCPTCPGNGDLDMSKILFQDFEGLDAGIFQMSWSWVGADGGKDDDDDDEKPKPKPKPKPSNNDKDDDDDDDDDDDKPKPKPKPSPTSTPKPKPTKEKDDDDEEEDKTSKTKSTKTKTSTSSSAEETTTSKKPKKTAEPESHNNLAGLSNVIAGLQNLALANHV
ncbi:hypothetical protein OC842_005395 [Tilletia horrida]|uniref:RlpA-like protein double-psi beta-barrel domain-containing protein n=1 Tax=Tilletia horrida TaxID=155126 RepID=A0AAN6G7Y2_9BASI|nr:hypothetical protein OC842_005395 [Tilletia horrida]